jgi:hypothetical protein
MYDPPLRLPVPKIVNLLTDLKEERDVGAKNSWVAEPMMKIISEFQESLKKYPPIEVGTPDPQQVSEPARAASCHEVISLAGTKVA